MVQIVLSVEFVVICRQGNNKQVVGKKYKAVLKTERDFEQEMKKFRLINDKETRFARYGCNFQDKLIRAVIHPQFRA